MFANNGVDRDVVKDATEDGATDSALDEAATVSSRMFLIAEAGTVDVAASVASVW
jgi:hypothetical protein